MRPLFALSALLLATALPADAAPLYYFFTGVETTGSADTLSFTVPNPGAYLIGYEFTVNTTSLLFNGTTLLSAAAFGYAPGYPADTVLQTDGGAFGLAFVGNLFSGSLSPFNPSPVLLTGTFTLDPVASIVDFPPALTTTRAGP